MRRGIFGTPIVPAFNAVAAKLIDVPLLGNVVRRNLVMISYVGRRRNSQNLWIGVSRDLLITS